MSNKKIAVALVDDDHDVRDAYTTLINSNSDFNCVGFASAEAFRTDFVEGIFDVVIMDVQLPGESGIECTKWLKIKSPNQLVLMFTVYENNENIFKALEAGANGYLLKQSSASSIIDSIKEVIGGGAPMSGLIARKVLAYFNPNNHKPANEFGLSEREMEILQLLAEGHRYQEIADKLFISFGTVRTHIYNIYNKMHVDNKTSAINKWKKT